MNVIIYLFEYRQTCIQNQRRVYPVKTCNTRMPENSSSGIVPRFLFFTALLLFLFSSPAMLFSEPRKVRVGVFEASPMVTIKNNKPEGLFIDLIEYFSRSLDWQLEYVPGTWSQHLSGLEKGEIDLLPAVGYTDRRAEIYDFSRNPVYIDSGVVFTSPDITLHTIFDLQNMKVAALRGSIFTDGFIEYMKSFGVRCNIIYTDNNRAVMEAIVSGRAEAGVCIYSLGNELAREYPVTITPISFSPIALEFAVPKGMNRDIIAGIDTLMKPMVVDPESFYSSTFHKWTRTPPATKIPEWLSWSVPGILVIGLLLIVWNFTLKRQVFIKTVDLKKEISERVKAEKKISESLAEKETLIRELYHRTKNTMQVIRGMIILQADEFPGNVELQQLIKITEDRIQAISLVHQMLYKSQDLSHISIKEYISELAGLIFQSFGISDERIKLSIDVEDQFFLIDTAIPFGLILNELMTNSLKHAFPDNRHGAISITLAREGSDKNILHYSDDGAGVPEGFDFRDQNTLGLKLVHSIGEMQMMGKVTFKNLNGVKCSVEISTGLYKERI